MDKNARLADALGNLPRKEALALAHAVEMQRLRGKETLPTDIVLAALRPHLQEARAPRVPTLRRLVCAIFDPFLTDREDEPRLLGRIARRAITPWWRAVGRIAGAELLALEQRLAALYETGPPVGLNDFALEAQEAASGWTQSLAAELSKPRADPAVRQLFPRAGLVADVKAMATILAMAGPLGNGFAAIERTLDTGSRLDGRFILDLGPDAVTLAKQHYGAISESHGMDAVLLAIGLLNRLRHPWHILRLGRAMSWKNNDAMLHDTEFGAVGERLVLGLKHLADDIVALAEQRAAPIDPIRFGAAVLAYMDEAEGLLGEFGFRRDSAWGETILQTRVALSNALDRDFLGRLAEQLVLAKIVPVERRSGGTRAIAANPDLGVLPDAAAIADAVAAVRLIVLMAQRGTRHGLGQAAREAAEPLGEEITKRSGVLLEALQAAPDHPAITAQLIAAGQVLDTMFEDGRGDTLMRRMRLASQASA
jgi:hypothetical protein